MQSIRIKTLKKSLDKKDLKNLFLSDSFCEKNCSKNKCINFYRNAVASNDVTILRCPYGYTCFKPSQYSEYILTSIVSNASDMVAIRRRNKIKGSQKEKNYDINYIREKFNSYNNYINFIEICNNICHDLNNALVYFKNLLDGIDKEEEVWKSLSDSYEKIITLIQPIQDKAVLKDFDINNIYSYESIKNDLDVLVKYLTKTRDYCEKTLDNYNESEKPSIYSLLCGPSLLLTLLKRNLFMYDADIYKQNLSSFSIHKMVKKVCSMLKMKADNNRTIIDKFEGFTSCKIKNYSDGVFATIFTLVDNAIKYALPVTDIVISFKETNDSITVSIDNQCVDLSKDDIMHIHERGYRGANKTEKGSGLGLFLVDYICKQCNIENHASNPKGHFVYSLTFKK